MAGFNFKGTDQQKKVGKLSGGERNRLHLAKLLRSGGNLLLLDEPTNDLDVDTLRALEEALLSFAGCAVVVSHDRWFLDRIATHVLAFEGDSQVRWFEGNFEAYESFRHEQLGAEADRPHRITYKKLVRGLDCARAGALRRVPSKAVLITGCSSGIGRATAEPAVAGRLEGLRHRPPSRDDRRPQAEQGCKTLALDVTDEASMSAAVAAVTEAQGAVGVLVNNAGYSQSGAVETVPLDQVRRQFETNVFGLLRMCQLVLPGMREQHWGKIVNISSMGGTAHVPRRRDLPRHQVRGRGDQRRAALRGARLRRRRDPGRARA